MAVRAALLAVGLGLTAGNRPDPDKVLRGVASVLETLSRGADKRGAVKPETADSDLGASKSGTEETPIGNKDTDNDPPLAITSGSAQNETSSAMVSYKGSPSETKPASNDTEGLSPDANPETDAGGGDNGGGFSGLFDDLTAHMGPEGPVAVALAKTNTDREEASEITEQWKEQVILAETTVGEMKEAAVVTGQSTNTVHDEMVGEVGKHGQEQLSQYSGDEDASSVTGTDVVGNPITEPGAGSPPSSNSASSTAIVPINPAGSKSGQEAGGSKRSGSKSAGASASSTAVVPAGSKSGKETGDTAADRKTYSEVVQTHKPNTLKRN